MKTIIILSLFAFLFGCKSKPEQKTIKVQYNGENIGIQISPPYDSNVVHGNIITIQDSIVIDKDNVWIDGGDTITLRFGVSTTDGGSNRVSGNKILTD